MSLPYGWEQDAPDHWSKKVGGWIALAVWEGQTWHWELFDFKKDPDNEIDRGEATSMLLAMLGAEDAATRYRP